MPDTTHQFTRLLQAYRDGDTDALDRLVPMIYDELRMLARRQRRRRGGGHTVNTTALVHEAYFKLAGQEQPSWENRLHFFRVAAQAMRHILIDYARSRQAAKRGGDAQKMSLNDTAWSGPAIFSDDRAEELLVLDEALEQLADLDERQHQIVELRYFVGLTIDETADVLGISASTVKREWAMARAWLYRQIRKKQGGEGENG